MFLFAAVAQKHLKEICLRHSVVVSSSVTDIYTGPARGTVYFNRSCLQLCLSRCLCVCLWMSYHNNSNLHASIFNEMGLYWEVVTISSSLHSCRLAPPGRGLQLGRSWDPNDVGTKTAIRCKFVTDVDDVASLHRDRRTTLKWAWLGSRDLIHWTRDPVNNVCFQYGPETEDSRHLPMENIAPPKRVWPAPISKFWNPDGNYWTKRVIRCTLGTYRMDPRCIWTWKRRCLRGRGRGHVT